MRNHLDKRVLRRAWTTRPSDRESAFPDGVELVSHLTDCKGPQMRGEQLGPLRGKLVLGQKPAARAAALGHSLPKTRRQSYVRSPPDSDHIADAPKLRKS